MLKKLSIVALALSLLLLPALACQPQQIALELQLKGLTGKIKQAVQIELNNTDLDLSNAAAELSRTGLSGDEARNILNELVVKHPFIIDTCTTDLTVKMVTVAPDAYRQHEGTDISTQDVMIKFMETKQPMLSQMFPAVEGVDGVIIIWPVVSQDGEFMGSVSAFFKPETLFATLCMPEIKGTGIAIDVMQLDGLDIYDSRGNDTGVNLFTDPASQQYTELVALGHRMVAEESGSGSYTNIDHDTGQMVKKQAYWDTIQLHGTAWRLMLNHIIE
ncbi:MAG TPA: hypothetical protein VF366_05410 [Dehalococcoidia bacterium]|jgi:hypothetical protein